MRTVMVPRSATVAAQIEALPRQVRNVAERIIGGLAIEPELGRQIARGVLRDTRARVVVFDEATRVALMVSEPQGRHRRGDEPVESGPRWRVVYWERIHRGLEIRFVGVLAVGLGHAGPGERNAYEMAGEVVRARRTGGER